MPLASYPGVAQLVARMVRDHEAVGSNPATRTTGEPWNRNGSRVFLSPLETRFPFGFPYQPETLLMNRCILSALFRFIWSVTWP